MCNTVKLFETLFQSHKTEMYEQDKFSIISQYFFIYLKNYLIFVLIKYYNLKYANIIYYFILYYDVIFK